MKAKKFYETLQSPPNTKYENIRQSKTAKEKAYYIAMLALSAFLILFFCVLVSTLVDRIFGEEFELMSVVLVIMILTFRDVPFGYCIGDTLWALAVELAILLFVPTLTLFVPAWTLIFIHFICIFALISITCQNPEMGLAGMIVLCYALLFRDPIPADSILSAIGMFVFCYVILALVIILAHRKKNRGVRFIAYFKRFKIKDRQYLWHIRLALGLAIVLTVGMALKIPRFTWIAFACSTILAQYPYAKDSKGRIWERIEGVALGCVGFFIVAQFVPQSSFNVIGLASGFVMGFTTKYRSKTFINCFGPLAIAAPIYGVWEAPFMRIMNNVVGAVFAVLFALVYDKVIVERLVPKEESKLPEGPEKE
ncbi:MAG: FUSC family protein [Bacteroidales bacterium]|nr:FUSC family protein [Bacteroidales bacterium]